MDIRFDDRVVTGDGVGLGGRHALGLATPLNNAFGRTFKFVLLAAKAKAPSA